MLGSRNGFGGHRVASLLRAVYVNAGMVQSLLQNSLLEPLLSAHGPVTKRMRATPLMQDTFCRHADSEEEKQVGANLQNEISASTPHTDCFFEEQVVTATISVIFG